MCICWTEVIRSPYFCVNESIKEYLLASTPGTGLIPLFLLLFVTAHVIC